MKTIATPALALLTATVLSGCAGMAFNEIELTLSRNITVGQELMDLEAAHQKGIISDTEYAKAKQDILKLVSALGEMDKD